MSLDNYEYRSAMRNHRHQILKKVPISQRSRYDGSIASAPESAI